MTLDIQTVAVLNFEIKKFDKLMLVLKLLLAIEIQKLLFQLLFKGPEKKFKEFQSNTTSSDGGAQKLGSDFWHDSELTTTKITAK